MSSGLFALLDDVAALLWVGGGILVHGLESYGFGWLGHLFQDLGVAGGQTVPGFGGVLSWLIGAALAAVTGLGVGAIAIIAMHFAVEPLLRSFRPATS